VHFKAAWVGGLNLKDTQGLLGQFLGPKKRAHARGDTKRRDESSPVLESKAKRTGPANNSLNEFIK